MIIFREEEEVKLWGKLIRSLFFVFKKVKIATFFKSRGSVTAAHEAQYWAL